MQEALAKKLVGMYKTIGGPQTGLQYRYISEQHVAATPSTYLSMALSLGKKKGLAVHYYGALCFNL